MAAIGLTLADVADDATRNLRTKRLPLVGVDNAVDDFVLVFRVLKADMKKEPWDVAIGISNEAKENALAGKHAIYFVFKSDTKEKSLCTLLDFYFTFAE